MSAREWRLFCYVTGELSSEESAAVEAELQTELLAGETTLADEIARVSQLVLVAREAAAETVVCRAGAVPNLSGTRGWRRSVLAMGIGLAGVGAWWLALSVGSRVEPLSGEQQALVAAWIEAELPGSREGDVVGLVAEVTPEGAEEEAIGADELEVPGWLEAAVANDG